MIQTVEERSLNAWPSLQQLLDDGWILRFANGYTRRANSVNPMYGETQEVRHKIRRCTQRYLDRNLRPVFRITPLAYPPNLDELLDTLGFSRQSPTSVQILDLASLPAPATDTLQIWSEFSPEWEEHFVQLNGHYAAQRDTHQAILRNIVPEKCFAALSDAKGKVVACGLGVGENDYVGLFDIITAQHARRKGYGQALILNILDWAKRKGAKKAYLSVEIGNRPALNLYAKLGFLEIYRYWYRVKEA